MRKIIIGGSRSYKFSFFSWAIKRWTGQTYSHVYMTYKDLITGQVIIAESSNGESHKVTLENWEKKRRAVVEIEIEVSDPDYSEIMYKVNESLQVKYSMKNIFGIIFYDIGMKRFAKKFHDSKSGYICSEEMAYILDVLGVKFDRPLDFVRPDHIIDKLIGSGIGTIVLDNR